MLHIDLDVPDNLNELLDQIQTMPLPTTVFLRGNAFTVNTLDERNMLLVGLQTMWDILDDRNKQES